MNFDKFLTNMQSMLNEFEDNNGLLNEAQKIQLILQKFNIPRLNQVKNELQVSYDLDQEKLSCLTSFPKV